MAGIGVNNSGIPQDLILGREKGKFGKGIEDKQKAVDLAKIMPGSELVYQGKDGNWTVSELKEEGVISGSDDLSIKDKSNIVFDTKGLKSIGISNASYSLFEEVADDATKKGFASDKNTSPEVLSVLAKDNNPSIRALVAANPHTPPETLKGMINDSNHSFNKVIHSGEFITKEQNYYNNPPMDIGEYQSMQQDNNNILPADTIQKLIAANPSTPAETVKKLLNDMSWSLDPVIRAGAAACPRASFEQLNRLAEDPDIRVKQAVAANPKSVESVELIKKFLTDPDINIKRSFATNPALQKDLFKEMAKDKDPDVKYNLYYNPQCPAELKSELKAKILEMDHLKAFNLVDRLKALRNNFIEVN